MSTMYIFSKTLSEREQARRFSSHSRRIVRKIKVKKEKNNKENRKKALI